MLPDKARDKRKRETRTNRVDRRKVSEKSKQKLEDAINELEGSEAVAVRELAHIVTGDDRFDNS